MKTRKEESQNIGAKVRKGLLILEKELLLLIRGGDPSDTPVKNQDELD